ncbi:MAG: type II toxin-antitoxin system RelE/ParE family toxin [Cyclobacteriaceae bacterium]|nr:type II toxin-antitoxin system RelE/ParE family toxin [Cyclobacteriaceae bacterium SS2]
MAKRKIIWSIRAQQDRLQILEYWIERNKSKTYSEKLYNLFNSAIELIAIHPEIGKKTSEQGKRAKIVRDYMIFYQEGENQLDILAIWDTRQNPEKIEKIIRKKSR